MLWSVGHATLLGRAVLLDQATGTRLAIEACAGGIMLLMGFALMVLSTRPIGDAEDEQTPVWQLPECRQFDEDRLSFRPVDGRTADDRDRDI